MPETTGTHRQLLGMRRYVESGCTRSLEFRRQHLLRLRDAILKYEDDIYLALHLDLHKSREEVYATEIGIVLAEIRIALKNLRRWTRDRSVRTNLLNFPSRSRVIRDPLGVVFIIAPWNYPVQLLLAPLVGAIAGGNAVVLKPSELAPATAALMEKMISGVFSPRHVSVVCGEGTRVIAPMMHEFRFDHVFFTGSTAVGNVIYQYAAKKLAPVTLELGGKNPAVVEKDADLAKAARRIALGKFLNAGQTCAAPDYLLLHSSIKDAFLNEFKRCLEEFFGGNPAESRSYGRIVNDRRFEKLTGYLNEGQVILGGGHSAKDRYIAPTVIEGVSLKSEMMREEIFGPILPVFTFGHMLEAKDLIAQNPSPLSFYLFTNNSALEKLWLDSVSFGGGCVNNTLWQLSNHHLPFGGIGSSGIGAYHGKHSFDLFTHAKPVMKTPLWFDPKIKYPPFEGKLKWFKKMIR
jgi:aldehyde dehydrogenase (NAD+)